jgi:hypothetical protein
VIEEYLARFSAFKDEALTLFATDERSVHRIISINQTYDRLTGLSVKQDDLLRQALRCVEVGAYRAAHVMAWSALVDHVQEKMGSDGFIAINTAMPKWHITDVSDLRERFTEFACIDAAKAAMILTKNQAKALHGLLSRRNECAHPSSYYPDLNQSLGYVSEVITRFDELK